VRARNLRAHFPKAVLTLDAMGVLYKNADDVGDLLVPFVRDHGGTANVDDINRAYVAASLGQITADQLWRSIGVDPRLEDEYLQGHVLAEGTMEMLSEASALFSRICCLSNDIPRWSRRLRDRFGLREYIAAWFISGDMGCRKPALEIYDRLLFELDEPPNAVVFVDDRMQNVLAAKSKGITAILFGASSDDDSDLPCPLDMTQLRAALRDIVGTLEMR